MNDTFISISPEIVLLSLAGTWLEQQIPYNRGTWFPEAVSEGIKNSIFKPLKCVYKLEASKEKALKKKLSNKRMVKISIKLIRENRSQLLCIVDKVNWPP